MDISTCFFSDTAMDKDGEWGILKSPWGVYVGKS